ncbi:MAG: SUF system NifU family Fe-S cluster assembly protein [bacterium]
MELDELYQDIILDHSRRPRNYGELAAANVHANGDNPSCGDEIAVHLRLNERGVVEDIRFTGQGCAISQAAASLMTLQVKGKTRDEALALVAEFQNMLTGGPKNSPASPTLGDLRIFQGVQKFPQRVKCATLAFQALKQALSEQEPPQASASCSCG